MYEPGSKTYRKYRQRVQELRKGMIMESDMRKKEAEENAIAEIAESSGSGPGKGIRNMLSTLSVVNK